DLGPRLQAGEDVLELHHPGIGEHERRVVARDERARRNDLVPVALEIVEECRPDVVDATHAYAFAEARLFAMRAKGTAPFSVGLGTCPENEKTAGMCSRGPCRQRRQAAFLEVGTAR